MSGDHTIDMRVTAIQSKESVTVNGDIYMRSFRLRLESADGSDMDVILSNIDGITVGTHYRVTLQRREAW